MKETRGVLESDGFNLAMNSRLSPIFDLKHSGTSIEAGIALTKSFAFAMANMAGKTEWPQSLK